MMYAVTARTESGDEYFVGLFDEEPTNEHYLAFAHQYDEVFDGECYMHCETHEVKRVEKLPEPYTKGDVSFI